MEVLGGEVHGLIGHNGAGKSTLIKVMAGVLNPLQGDLLVDGQTVPMGSPAASYQAGLRFIHQNAPLVPIFDAVENCFLGRSYPRRRGLIDRRAMRGSVVDTARMLAPELPLDVPVGALSAGMRQLVLIVRALSDRGRMLILDEPTAALSADESKRLFEAIAVLRRQGVGLVFVSHRLDEVLANCDRITALRDGQVVETRAAASVEIGDLVAQIGGENASQRPLETGGRNLAPGLAISGLRLWPGAPAMDLHARRGEIVVLYGRSGSARSRLLRAIWGDARVVDGAMTLCGESYSPNGPRQAIARGVAFVPDDRRRHGLFADLGLVENMAMPRLPAFRTNRRLPVINRSRQRRAFALAARQLGLKFGADRQRATTLSGGNQQKLLFARWMASNPVLLLLDEPTEGVDVRAKAEIHRLIRQFAKGGAAVIVASSDLDQAMTLGDRIIVMRSGHVVADCTPTATNAHALESAAQAAVSG